VLYAKQPLSHLAAGALASEPLLVRTSENGPLALFSETDLQSYPGQWMRVGSDRKSLDAAWPGYPAREEPKSDRSVAVTEREPYIARVHGTRTLPWRFVALAANDGELLTNTLSYVLAEPSRLADTAWIKPGKVQWDWWHDFNVWDVAFHGGISQQLYLHYIDFAAAHHLQYVLLDEGWYKLGNLLEPANGIDVPALVAHARDKGIRIQLWMTWKTLREQLEPAMAQFERWGVAGLKVDFFDRDDQPMVDFYWKLAAEAAKRHLTLDFHGAHKPAGLLRTYPNVLTVEGVRGAEYNKWSDTVTPEHNLQLPFTRMVAGPMDYTPGGMDNTQPEQFRARNRRPMVMDTRAAELAKYVVFESPLQMLADSPSAYRAAPESLAFLSIVPTTWDETRVLAARVGEYVAVARRSGKQWFIGAMNAGDARELTLDLSFVPAGASFRVWRDGPNADRDGRDVQCVSLQTAKTLKINLAPNGGWAASTAGK
jgi:alpha-glucosidase